MNQEINLNPMIVHDAAASLFWTMADAVGVAGANEAVIESDGQCLLEQLFTAAILDQYGFEKMPRNVRQEFCSAIAAESERFAMRGENMNGVVYIDEAQAGRTPSAQHINTDSLEVIPRRVITTGAKIEKIGRLCLRHPLPAVVFSETQPHGDIFEVADTSAALGFHLPIFLTNAACQQLDDHLFMAKGIFYIPVPDTHHGDLWNAAIQNSTRFVKGVNFYGGHTKIEVQW